MEKGERETVTVGAAGRSRRGVRETVRKIARRVVIVGLAAAAGLAAGCDGGSGGSGGTGGAGAAGGSGGTGAAGGSGGGTATTSTPTIDACPIGAEAHAAAILVDPAGMPAGTGAVDITGTASAAGLDAPPSAECGSGQAWVSITDDGGTGEWLACFQAPSLVWSVTAGDAVQLTQAVTDHPIAPASMHTTLRANGALVAHVEQATYEDEVALPDGVAVARGEQACSSPDDACMTEGYSVTASAGGQSATIAPGEAGIVGGLRVYVDRYWLQNVSSACDAGDASVLLAVTPAPPD